MPQWIACIIAYNEEKLLPGCLASLQGKVDRVILVDGRIAHFPGDSPYSTDATAEIARHYGAEVIRSEVAWPDEIIMRTQYLRGREGDWYLMIDADEGLMTTLPNIEWLGGAGYRVVLEMLGFPGQTYTPARLFRHHGRMKYKFAHHALFSDEILVSLPQQLPLLKSVQLIHRQPMRVKARWREKRVKRQLCYEQEKEDRERLGFNG